jgi:hypothetical protein
MTRRLPEGPWDPMKIPRIQNSVARVAFLLTVDDAVLPQLDDKPDELDQSMR